MKKEPDNRLLRTLLSLLLLSSLVSSAQVPEEYLYWHIGTSSGLIFDEVMNVQQDSKGYLWIATLNGLQRYDGKRFVTFRHNAADSSSLPGDRIQWMQMDKKDRLWMLFTGNRVGYMTVNDLKFHLPAIRYDEDVRKKAMAHVFIDNNDHVSLRLFGNAVLTYDDKLNEFAERNTAYRWPTGWRPHTMTQDPNGNYWIACDSGLAKYNPQKKTLSWHGHNVDNDPIIKAFGQLASVALPLMDKKGRFWLESWPPTVGNFSLYHYEPATGKLVSHTQEFYRQSPTYMELISLQEQQDGTIWASGTSLFFRLGPQDTAFRMMQN
ncbi:MAG: hypothetical protein JST39_04770, partial [Bacteroidetes bacterium]|nr:hypothetical protein [Bacteroidota bacterium]